jgi:hypothetical protein
MENKCVKVPHKQGYLKKLGGKFKTWKKRYFVLDGPKLHYYKEQNGELIGTITLSAECVVTLDLDKADCIQVKTKTRTWHFIASNEEDMNSWHGAFQESIWLDESHPITK